MEPSPKNVAARFVAPDGFYVEIHSPMGPKDQNNWEYSNKFDRKSNYWVPYTKAESDRVTRFHDQHGGRWRITEVRDGRERPVVYGKNRPPAEFGDFY